MLKLLALELAGADSVTLAYGEHEHAAIADFSGARGLNDGLDHFVNDGVMDDDVNLHLGEQADVVLLSAIDGRVALLLAMPADFGHGDARDIERSEERR